jgi:hypothetical protein
MEGTREQNEYRKNPEPNFTSSTKRTKINWMCNKDTGRKYETVTGQRKYETVTGQSKT